MFSEHGFDPFAGFCADGFEKLTACTNENFLVGVFVDMDDELDARDRTSLVEALDHNSNPMGDLFARLAEDLLPDELGDEEAYWFVRQRLVVEELGLDRQEVLEFVEEPVGAIGVERADRHEGGERVFFGVGFEHGEQRGFVFESVDFVEGQDDRFGRGEGLEDGSVGVAHGLAVRGLRARANFDLGEEHHDVGLVESAEGEGVHADTEAGFCGVDSGGVEEYELGVWAGEDPEDLVAGGLRVGARDGDGLAEERVEKGAFADIGATDDGDGTGVMGLLGHETRGL